jgi:CBS domain-containing protein
MGLRARLSDLRGLALGGDSRDLRVEQAMSTDVVTVAPDETVRGAANRMADNELAAALVEAAQPGILTARDVLEFVGAGHDADAGQVGDHSTREARSTSPSTPLDDAARAMVEGEFRHLVVADAGRTVGLLAIRDLVRCWVEARATPHAVIPIRKAMNVDFLTLGVDETIQDSARAMAERGAAAAVVEPTDARRYPGIFTEREVLLSLRADRDPGSERLADHLASSMTFSAPGWSLSQAAEAMTKGGFQHIVVVDPHEIRGVISMRDVVRKWVSAGG